MVIAYLLIGLPFGWWIARYIAQDESLIGPEPFVAVAFVVGVVAWPAGVVYGILWWGGRLIMNARTVEPRFKA